MVLYTPLPPELVLEGLEPKRHFKEAVIGGIPAVVEEVSTGRGRLVRLLSTDPFDYLNPSLSPGKMVIIC
ncbi:MAG: YlzJ-like family protein [Bacillota bacterium]